MVNITERKERRGFASMSAEKQREIASKGGRAAHEKGTAHEWTADEARNAGRKVMCVKYQKELPGLDSIPWPGELGQRIFDNVSKDAWKLWEERMKMILNEYRLMPWQKEAQDLVAKHMEDFFFGDSAALPPDFVPQQAK